jgi:AGCS family alanine or glycine:cation symporter
MAIPTMIATIILAPKVITELKAYLNRLKQSKNESNS